MELHFFISPILFKFFNEYFIFILYIFFYFSLSFVIVVHQDKLNEDLATLRYRIRFLYFILISVNIILFQVVNYINHGLKTHFGAASCAEMTVIIVCLNFLRFTCDNFIVLKVYLLRAHGKL